MPTKSLCDQSGRRLDLGKSLGVGGEGEVFEVVGNSSIVAKVYHNPPTKEKEQKLAVMVRMASPNILKIASWPQKLLYEQHSNGIAGLVMPRIGDAIPIHELYGPSHRRVHFPMADWRLLIRAARNLAAAVLTIHETGIVIGDVNQGNIRVSKKAIVSLVDCDSFQIESKGTVFRCPVGVVDYTPPELQGSRFDDVTRTPNHDCFGLAVIIFQLLFMGRHPHVGRFHGRGEMPTLEASISQCGFAYGSRAKHLNLSPPPHSLELPDIPSYMSSLFERAFAVDGARPQGRPTARQWYDALSQFERQLAQCSIETAHVYATGVPYCPWCRIVGQGGPSFFAIQRNTPPPTRPSVFDTAAYWRQVCTVPKPSSMFRPTPRQPPARIAKIQFERSSSGMIRLRSALLISGLSAILGLPIGLASAYALAVAIPIFIICALAWIYLYYESPESSLTSQRRKAQSSLRIANSAVNESRHKLQAALSAADSQFEAIKTGLQDLVTKHAQLDQLQRSEIHTITTNATARQFDEYMRRKFIWDAKIPDIGPQRITMLASYGIQTAYDISPIIDQIPSFGPRLVARLMDWKQHVAQSFRPDASIAISDQDLHSIEWKYYQLRRQIEAGLELGRDRLWHIQSKALPRFEELDMQLSATEQRASEKLAQLSAFPRRQIWW